MSRRFSELSNLASDRNERPLLPNRNSVGDDVYEALLTQLITLKIAPGERIAVDALVRELGVSQTPIRAALIRLETEGLVARKHNAGFSAAPIPSGDRFRDLYEFRLLMEPAAAALATERMTTPQRAELADVGHAMEACLKDESAASYGRFAVLDARFHEIIAEGCGNEIIAEALGRLYTHMHLFRLRHHETVTEGAVMEHARILKAIAAGEANAASAAMREHIALSRDRMEPFYRARK
ncbi:MAG TPA: GntR family transcriptional regulator [Caulobacterales bacterium]|nr:GntR family transcriptional regulator [Caulobacterales bacterium]